MTWPATVESIDQIPMSDADRERLGPVDEDTARALCWFIETHGGELAEITDGDADKEAQLGYIIASAGLFTAMTRERDMRGWSTV